MLFSGRFKRRVIILLTVIGSIDVVFIGCWCRPDFATAWMNLAIVQAARQQYATAEQSYKTALRHRHRYPDCFYNLGNLVPKQTAFSFIYYFIYLVFFVIYLFVCLLAHSRTVCCLSTYDSFVFCFLYNSFVLCIVWKYTYSADFLNTAISLVQKNWANMSPDTDCMHFADSC